MGRIDVWVRTSVMITKAEETLTVGGEGRNFRTPSSKLFSAMVYIDSDTQVRKGLMKVMDQVLEEVN